MSNSDFNFNFNNDGEQQSFDVIPENTVCTVQMTVRPGGAGEGGWLKRAQDGRSEHLDCEFVVTDGVFAKRKFWNRFTVKGTDHAEAISISREVLRAMLESAYGLHYKDKSDAAELIRKPKGFEVFDQLRFMVRIGVEPSKDGYAAKNIIREVITPKRKEWKKVDQIDRDLVSKPATAARSQPGATQPAAPPANAIARPNWAKPDQQS